MDEGERTERHRAPERTRERLIEAAEASFAELGYRTTTIQQMCRRAGVSVGSFYHHFEDKPDLTLQVLERGHDRLLATLSTIDVSRPATIESAVAEVIEGPNAALYRSMREAVEIEPAIREASLFHLAILRDHLVAAIEASRTHPASGYALDAHSVAWTFLALVREALAGLVHPGQSVGVVIARAVSQSAADRR
ncbi:MAG: hypothetical protein QOH08_598 [Chloroflexota bacterium]|jgi:AcrR family transcriptional regulator|nr:hypothetical protein [Chloroflexota bacterium]